YAEGLGNLALLHYKQGRYKDAEILIQQAKQICLRSYGRENLVTSFMYLTAGNIALENNDISTARKNYEEAAAIRESLIGKEHVDYAEVLEHLALLETRSGRYGEAERLLQMAEAIRLNILGEGNFKLADSYRGL